LAPAFRIAPFALRYAQLSSGWRSLLARQRNLPAQILFRGFSYTQLLNYYARVADTLERPMAKVHFTPFVPDDVFFISLYDVQMFATKPSKSGFELHGEGPDFVEVHGVGLKYRRGYLVDGTITDVEFKNGLGNDYVTVKNVNFEIEQKTDISNMFMFSFFEMTTTGNDRVNGSLESDVLFGGAGKNVLNGLNGNDTLIGGQNDTLTGKQGSDIFCFFGRDVSKRVVVTDFVAEGGGDAQDYFFFTGFDANPRIYQDRDNTVLDFGSRHRMILVDVDRGDISMEDFKTPPAFTDM
jgi:hypothetical protein